MLLKIVINLNTIQNVFATNTIFVFLKIAKDPVFDPRSRQVLYFF